MTRDDSPSPENDYSHLIETLQTRIAANRHITLERQQSRRVAHQIKRSSRLES